MTFQSQKDVSKINHFSIGTNQNRNLRVCLVLILTWMFQTLVVAQTFKEPVTLAFFNEAKTENELPTLSLDQLPKEGQRVYRLIWEGGPFEFDKDGTIFGNRERILPKYPRGYYREYTVRTPRSRDRGARRIICGGFVATKPDACYYTADHYSSFRKMID